MKIQRWEVGFANYTGDKCDNGRLCKSEDVAELEAKYVKMESLNAEMLDIIESLHHCSDYWSEYYVPIGIVQRMEKVIAQAKGRQP